MGTKKFTYIIALIITSYCYGQEKTEKFSFQNPELPFEERVNDLVKHLTLEEKVSQMLNSSPAISRLGIPAYDWWNETLHGVA